MTETATKDVTITPDETVYMVLTIDDGAVADGTDSGTFLPYTAATDARISDGTLTMLGGSDVLDTFGKGEWAFVGRVHLAPGQYEVQRDGRAVVCRGECDGTRPNEVRQRSSC